MIPTFRFGLLGWPLTHSLSPHLHQTALQACGWNGDYRLYPIPPLPSGQTGMAALLQQLREKQLDGLNVTIPHKQAVIPLLDEVTPTASQIGAVNTIFRSGRKLVGDNTDSSGFLLDFQQKFPGASAGKVLVVGAGGGARAVVYALASLGWQVYVVSRNPERAQALTAGFAHLKPSPVSLPDPLVDSATVICDLNVQLLVNATPLGMPPLDQRSPWPENTRPSAGCIVYDLVYDPLETLLLKRARLQGLATANGLGMLVNQAALSFLVWTDLPEDKFPFIHTAMQKAINTSIGIL